MLDIPNLSPRTNAVATPLDTAIVKPTIMPKKKKRLNPVLKYTLIIVALIVLLAAVSTTALFLFVYLPAQKFYTQAQSLNTDVDKLKNAVTNKDLKDAKVQIDNLKSKLNNLQNSFNKFSYMRSLPRLKDYYADGQRIFDIGNNSLEAGQIVIQAVEPYQDFLGLKGASTSSSKTTEDRIAFLTQSIEGLLPHMDSVETKIAKINESLNQIDPNRYPIEFRGYQIRSNLLKAKETINQAYELVKNSKPILSKTSWLLGKDKPRDYLVVFQNDGELRPSGGFWTAFATIKINKGKVIPGLAGNIYDIDDKLQSVTPSPRIIKSYHINVPYLNLRDSNLSPDFPTDAQIFLTDYYKAMGKKETFDAVIALDTNVLVDLVKVLGKLDTRVGTFTTEPDKRCDGCPKIIYDLEWISGRPRNFIEKNRKDFLAPVMQALLSNAMGSEKTKIPLLGQAFFDNVFQKHIMFYFPDAETQKASELANISGKITLTDKTVDYFHLNDANFASAKSNIFIRQKIKHEITVKDGKVEHKVSVTYTNPSPASNCNLEKGDLCLNAPKYRDMFRFYVSPDSQFIKMTGSEIEPVIYDELGKKVFEGFYGNKYPLYAKASTKTSIQYISSVPASPNYTLLLQKQPGTKPVDYELWVNGQKQESFSWNGDKTIKLSL
jgi:hypothetical protein